MTKKNNKDKKIITHNIGAEPETVDKLYYLMSLYNEYTKKHYIDTRLVRYEDIVSILLYYFQYLPIEEVSKTLGKSSRAVQLRLQNTLDALYIICDQQFQEHYESFLEHAGIVTNPADGKKVAGVAADAMEIDCNTPQDYSAQNHMHSNKRGGTTMKIHAENDIETGRVGFISNCFGGSVHDKKVAETLYLQTDQDGIPILDSNGSFIFKHQDYPILGDKAYQGLKSFITPYKRSKDLTNQQLDHNSFINSNRISIENFFYKLKRFKILSTKYRGCLKNLDKIVVVLAFIVDLENPNRYETDFQFDQDKLNEIKNNRTILFQKKVKKSLSQ